MSGELWDLDRPLERDCSLEILRFDDEDAQAASTFFGERGVIIDRSRRKEGVLASRTSLAGREWQTPCDVVSKEM